MATNAVQVVLLGSGLDTRAWRLNFPSGTAVFEVDQLDMTNFKQQCLRNSLAQTDAASDSAPFKHPLKAANWASVATDLMHAHWLADLEAKGFQKGAHLLLWHHSHGSTLKNPLTFAVFSCQSL